MQRQFLSAEVGRKGLPFVIFSYRDCVSSTKAFMGGVSFKSDNSELCRLLARFLATRKRTVAGLPQRGAMKQRCLGGRGLGKSGTGLGFFAFEEVFA